LSAVLATLCLSAASAAPPPPVHRVRVDAAVAVNAIMGLTDECLSDTARSLWLLSLTQEIKSGDWDRMKGLLGEFESRNVEAIIWFARPDGSYYTLEKGLTDQNMKDRPYFIKGMAGQASLGDLVISRSTGKYVGVGATPVSRDGTVIGVLGASLYLDKLSERIARTLNLPSNVHFWASDPTAKIVALNRRTERLFWDPTNLDSPTLTQAVADMLAQPERGTITYDFQGKRLTGVYRTSPLTGWHFVLGALTTLK